MTQRPTIGVILKGYPRLSETFITQELLALERRGARLHLFSLRHPTDKHRHPMHDRMRAAVTYLPEYLHDEPGRVIRAWRTARRLPGYRAARARFLKDLARDRTRNRIRRFGQALVLAAEIGPSIRHLYAHFLHTPSSVARYAAIMRRVPWSLSAHAKDIWTTPDWDMREKLSEARFAVTCTASGQERMRQATPLDTDKIHLLHHGLDWDTIPTPPERPGKPSRFIRLLTIGRAVEKKGLDTLLDALKTLPQNPDWRWSHIGGGPLLPKLKKQAERLGLGERIDWLGAQPRDTVFNHLQQADIFILPSRVARDGDRDGIPNVLMEAMSQRVPCVATQAGAIPELIDDGRTGRLVAPGDPRALAQAICELIENPERRKRLGETGYAHVRQHFHMEAGIGRLATLLGIAQEPAP